MRLCVGLCPILSGRLFTAISGNLKTNMLGSHTLQNRLGILAATTKEEAQKSCQQKVPDRERERELTVLSHKISLLI
jgi:hypothetical protein